MRHLQEIYYAETDNYVKVDDIQYSTPELSIRHQFYDKRKETRNSMQINPD